MAKTAPLHALCGCTDSQRGCKDEPIGCIRVGLASRTRLPMRAFHRIFTKKVRIASPNAAYSEAFYLEAFDSTSQVFALLIPESELRVIKFSV
jgi:hypothetical protein